MSALRQNSMATGLWAARSSYGRECTERTPKNQRHLSSPARAYSDGRRQLVGRKGHRPPRPSSLYMAYLPGPWWSASFPSRRPFQAIKSPQLPLGLGLSWSKSAAGGASGRRFGVRYGLQAWGGLRRVRIRGLQCWDSGPGLRAGALRSRDTAALVEQVGHGDYVWQSADLACRLGDRPGLVAGG